MNACLLVVFALAVAAAAPAYGQQGGEAAVTVHTDGAEFSFGEDVRIFGNVSGTADRPSHDRSGISITITGPGYEQELSLHPDSEMNYETSLDIKEVLGFGTGTYSVTASYMGATAETSFAVVTVADAVVGELGGEDFAVWIDRESYIPGQAVAFTARAAETVQFEGLEFTVYDPVGLPIIDGTLYPRDGKFSTEITTSPIHPLYGKHLIVAEYAGNTARETFTLVPEILGDESISLSTDRRTYDTGDTVVITGRLNHIWTFSLDMEISQIKGGEAIRLQPYAEQVSVRLDGDSTFRHEFAVPDDPNRYGQYRIAISESVGTAEAIFEVSSDIEPDPDAPLTVGTDRTSYEIGSAITISGRVDNVRTNIYNNIIDAEIVRIGDLSAYGKSPAELPDRTPYTTLSTSPDAAGDYTIRETIQESIFDPGTYVVRISYADGAYQTSEPFTITGPAAGGGTVLEINKDVFGLGETVVISGSAPGLGQGSDVKITLHKPDGDTDVFGAAVDESRFSWTWKTPISERSQTVFSERSSADSNYGTYRASIFFNDMTHNVFFRVSEDPDSAPDTRPISISTDRESYSTGETMKVSGTAKKQSRGGDGLVFEERVDVYVASPFNPSYRIYDASLYLDAGGRFETQFQIPSGVFSDGKYMVTAQYDRYRADAEFTVSDEFVGGERPALELGTDRDEYRPGDTVHVTARPGVLIHLDSIDITIIQEDDVQNSCGESVCGIARATEKIAPSESGLFEYEYRIPESDRIERYEVLAGTDFAVFSAGFAVDDAPEEPPQARQVRATEHFNRIAESSILISATQAEQNGTQLHPRTIQGSLFSPARGQEQGVNIMVTVADGTCVIGQADGCLVSGSTRGVGSIHQTVRIDGADYKVRYSGPDARLEKFAVVPAGDGPIHITDWSVDVLKDEQVSRFYYKITRVSQ